MFEGAAAERAGFGSHFVEADAAESDDRLDSFNNAPSYDPAFVIADADSMITEVDAEQELRAAVARLQANPGILSGDPDGLFSYDDPVLTAALMFAGHAAVAESEIVEAALPGEELRNGITARWMIVGIRAFFKRHDRSLVDLAAFVPARPEPLAPQRETVRLAIVGDAGYRGQAQRRVLQSIAHAHARQPFDAIVHLGDVYFAADAEAMFEHFLTPFMRLQRQGARLFTLCGNHDLYYGGGPYLKTLGIIGQPGRYFLLKSKHWRIACLDTSLAAPGVGRLQGKLDAVQLEWLEDVVAANDPRPLILMSHHFTISAWRDVSEPLKEQLDNLVRGKVLAWYWGHEHRAVRYDQTPHGFYGACVGNGSFIEKLDKPHGEPTPTWYGESACDCFGRANEYWPHGFVELELRPDELVERFVLENGSSPARRIRAPK